MFARFIILWATVVGTTLLATKADRHAQASAVTSASPASLPAIGAADCAAIADLERRVAEHTAQVVQAREAAEAANRTKSAFLATMSHQTTH